MGTSIVESQLFVMENVNPADAMGAGTTSASIKILPDVRTCSIIEI